MELLTRPQPEILKNWKEQNYEEIAKASQPFDPGKVVS